MASLFLLALALSEVEALANASTSLSINPQFEDALKVDLPAAVLKPGKTSLILDFTFEKGWHLNAAAPFQYSLDGARTVRVKQPKLPIKIAYLGKGKDLLLLGVILSYCREDGKGVCKTKTVLLRQPLKPDPKGPATLAIHFKPD